jgi:hypothetical protein
MDSPTALSSRLARVRRERVKKGRRVRLSQRILLGLLGLALMLAIGVVAVANSQDGPVKVLQ